MDDEATPMSAVTGFLRPTGYGEEDARRTIRRMTDALAHRGPDDEGHWLDPDAGIALGHRRLATLQLSPADRQPMVSVSGRYVVAMDGAIYNHLDLRAMLEAQGANVAWRGHSDTETLLACIDAWGIETALQRSVGAFALTLWDRDTRTLTLARDRLGEKPLYYGWQRGVLVFGSELKAFRVHPAFEGGIDRDALALYFRHGYIPAPYSIYQGVYKLAPGTYLKITPEQVQRGLTGAPVPYWSFAPIAEAGQREPFRGSEQEAIGELDRLLRQAVAGQMMSDVPPGALLSGGIDSATIVALMQAQSVGPVRTYTIGFHEGEYNEAQHAHAVARHLGTDHTELYVTAEHAMAVIPRLPTLYDEPFADSSQIPTFLVAELARRHITVCLSGDGGDELFGGYARYFRADSVRRRVGRIPGALRVPVGRILSVWKRGASNRRSSMNERASRLHNWQTKFGYRIQRLAEVLSADSPEALYLGFVSHWRPSARLIEGSIDPPYVLVQPGSWPSVDDFYHRMMALDTVSYLPDDVLVKIDRAAMAVSLEPRAPMMDHRVVEFAWTLPLSLKIREGQGKWILRQVLYRYVPPQLVERPKTGFGVPIDHWLRGPLRDWAEDLLDERRMREAGYLNPQPVRRMWTEHLTGQRDWQFHLWDVLMWEAWYRAVAF